MDAKLGATANAAASGATKWDAKLGATADAAASGATKCIDATSSSKIGYDNINTS